MTLARAVRFRGGADAASASRRRHRPVLGGCEAAGGEAERALGTSRPGRRTSACTRAIDSLRCSPGSARIGGPKRTRSAGGAKRPARSAARPGAAGRHRVARAGDVDRQDRRRRARRRGRRRRSAACRREPSRERVPSGYSRRFQRWSMRRCRWSAAPLSDAAAAARDRHRVEQQRRRPPRPSACGRSSRRPRRPPCAGATGAAARAGSSACPCGWSGWRRRSPAA